MSQVLTQRAVVASLLELTMRGPLAAPFAAVFGGYKGGEKFSSTRSRKARPHQSKREKARRVRQMANQSPQRWKKAYFDYRGKCCMGRLPIIPALMND